MTGISVVVAAYTLDRWSLLRACMESVLHQTLPAERVVLVIDNNEELFLRAEEEWGSLDGVLILRNPDVEHLASAGAHLKAHGSRRRFGAGSARNAGVAETSSEIVAIIDDDARAEPTWLEELVSPYADAVVAVGGPPIPLYETGRPAWFPRSFDWAFGCEYQGVPKTVAPYRRLIGANMSMRRSAFDAVGGFQSIDFEDLDLCTRLWHRFGPRSMLWAPDARVRHFVPAGRATWHYFWRRCFFVNAEKVDAFHGMAEAASLAAEVSFSLKTAIFGVTYELSRVARGQLDGVRAAGAILAGLALAAAGNVWGRVQLRRSVP